MLSSSFFRLREGMSVSELGNVQHYQQQMLVCLSSPLYGKSVPVLFMYVMSMIHVT